MFYSGVYKFFPWGGETQEKGGGKVKRKGEGKEGKIGGK